MSTRSMIAVQNVDGTILSVYAHWDGYLENNGRILLEKYNTEDKVRELISKGDISSLGDTIAETTFYATRGSWPDSRGGSDEPWKQVRPKGDESLMYFRKNLAESWTEFIYIFSVSESRWKWNRKRALVTDSKLHYLTETMVQG